MTLIIQQDLFNTIENILEKRKAKTKVYRYPYNSMVVDMPKEKNLFTVYLLK